MRTKDLSNGWGCVAHVTPRCLTLLQGSCPASETHTSPVLSGPFSRILSQSSCNLGPAALAMTCATPEGMLNIHLIKQNRIFYGDGSIWKKSLNIVWASSE